MDLDTEESPQKKKKKILLRPLEEEEEERISTNSSHLHEGADMNENKKQSPFKKK